MSSSSSPLQTIGTQIASTTVNSFLPGAGAVIGIVEGIFSKDHAAAVAKEASTINNAMPTFLKEVTTVMSYAQSGKLTPAEATSYLQQAETIYSTTVSGILKDNGECLPGCTLEADGHTYSSGHCCNSGSSCNAACCLRCGIVVPTVENLSAILAEGHGTYTIPPSVKNGSINGTAAVTITYKSEIVNGILGTALAPLVPSLLKSPVVLIGIALAVGALALGGVKK